MEATVKSLPRHHYGCPFINLRCQLGNVTLGVEKLRHSLCRKMMFHIDAKINALTTSTFTPRCILATHTNVIKTNQMLTYQTHSMENTFNLLENLHMIVLNSASSRLLSFLFSSFFLIHSKQLTLDRN